MDPLLPRKPQDVDRMPDADAAPEPADAATGPDDRWANEAARPDPDYPAAKGGPAGTGGLNAQVEDDGRLATEPEDPADRDRAR